MARKLPSNAHNSTAGHPKRKKKQAEIIEDKSDISHTINSAPMEEVGE